MSKQRGEVWGQCAVNWRISLDEPSVPEVPAKEKDYKVYLPK